MSPKQIRDMFVSSYLPTLQQANEILEHDCFYDLEPGQQEILSSTLEVQEFIQHIEEKTKEFFPDKQIFTLLPQNQSNIGV
jgi:hypothetical protein